MSARIQDLAGKLSRLNMQIKHNIEQAEAKVGELNRLIAVLADSDLLHRELCLGKAREVPRDLDIADGEGRVIQAMLLVPEGFGVCAWESPAEYARDRAAATFAKKARRRFQPFATAGTADKAFLLPYIETLLDELMDIADVAAARALPSEPVEAAQFIAGLRRRKGSKT